MIEEHPRSKAAREKREAEARELCGPDLLEDVTEAPDTFTAVQDAFLKGRKQGFMEGHAAATEEGKESMGFFREELRHQIRSNNNYPLAPALVLILLGAALCFGVMKIMGVQ